MVDSKESSESDIAAGRSDQIGSLVRCHAAHIKHGVYSMSNTACNKYINGLFSIAAVVPTDRNKRSIDRALDLAKSRGMNQSKFAEKMNVGAQDITNWKSRGMPTDKLEDAADTLHCSVDFLLGREVKAKHLPSGSAANVVQLANAWPFSPVTREQYDNLPDTAKEQIRGYIEGKVSESTAQANPGRKKLRG
jgi:transcriptional regulator with XRE-family HTH domain